jgi:hypothetical protein
MIPNLHTPVSRRQIEELDSARTEARAALSIAQEAMKTQHNRYGKEGPQWKIGDLVWLNGKNLKTQYPLAKLSPKWFGPFPIEQKIGTSSYGLTLPLRWKIHNVFHGSLLMAYQETDAHGAHFTRPTPTIIDQEEEFEVDQIMGV